MLARLIFAALIAFATALPAQASETDHYVFQGFAIGGTDPVAYFTDGAPTDGSDEFTAEYDGVMWKFASAANRDAFLADPAKYAPQYGGYCVTGMSFGQKVPIDPSQWDIVDGKLYLNNSPASRRVFMKDEPGTITRADGHWAEIESN